VAAAGLTNREVGQRLCIQAAPSRSIVLSLAATAAFQNRSLRDAVTARLSSCQRRWTSCSASLLPTRGRVVESNVVFMTGQG